MPGFEDFFGQFRFTIRIILNLLWLLDRFSFRGFISGSLFYSPISLFLRRTQPSAWEVSNFQSNLQPMWTKIACFRVLRNKIIATSVTGIAGLTHFVNGAL